MIYSNKTNTPALIYSTLAAARSLDANRFVLWFYPETPHRARASLRGRFQDSRLGHEPAEPVTVYDGKHDEEPPQLFSLSDLSIRKIVATYRKISRLCDSITTHRSGRADFVSASIFHERMTLFKDYENTEAVLAQRGIPFSRTPPGW